MRSPTRLLAFLFALTGCNQCGSSPSLPSPDAVSTLRPSAEPALAIDARGRPVAGWLVGVVGGNNLVQARRLEKGAWSDLAGLGDPREYNGPIAVAIGADDEPVAAWAAGKVPNVIRVAVWNHAAWIELPGADDRLGRSALPRVAAAADGRVVVTWWSTLSVGVELRVRQWNGTAWSTLPSPALGPDLEINRGAPDVVLDPSGAPVLAWSAATPGGSSVFVARWDGAKWAPFGSSLTGGGVSATTGESTHPRLALGKTGPMVAWVQREGSRRNAHFRRWTGSTWEELAGSATRHGLSHREYVTTVAVAANPLGDPLVTWGEGDQDEQDVYLLSWSGKSWEKAAGFASDRLSIPGTFSVLPAIASTPLKTCVVWNLYNGDQVVSRCAVP